MNLYWVDDAIYKLYEEFVNPETGELTDPEAFAAKYAKLDISRKKIIESTLLLYKNCVGDAEEIADEIKALKKRQAALEKRAERLKADAAEVLCGEKFHTAKVEVTWSKSTAVEVDESLCPAEYIVQKVTTSPNKKAITAALKAGTEIAGCKLVEKTNMTVR